MCDGVSASDMCDSLFVVIMLPDRSQIEGLTGLSSQKLVSDCKRVFVEYENSISNIHNGDGKIHLVKSSPIELTDTNNLSTNTTDSSKTNGIAKTKPDGTIMQHGWRAQLEPELAVLSQYDLDVLIGADGKRSCLGFPSKELRCRLALAITVNFVNYHTPAETQVEEISGVSSIFNQQFFTRLAADTGIDLENIVYYKDETHYFVMTAKKHSLLSKGVLRQDREDSNSLLSPENVDKQALQAFARETAHYVTNGKLSQLDFAANARGEPDVEVFDFTRMFAAVYSCRILERNDTLLMQCLIGDGLFEVHHLYITDATGGPKTNHWHKNYNGSLKAGTNRLRDQLIAARSVIKRTESSQIGSLADCSLTLLRWFQFRLAFYESLDLIEPVTDLSPSQWDSGVNLLCLIHLYRPDLIPEVEQFLFDSGVSSDPHAVLNRYTNAAHPKPSLIRACGLLIEHFDVQFILDTGTGTTSYPRSSADWQHYLGALQQSLGQLHMAGPPPLSGKFINLRSYCNRENACGEGKRRKPNQTREAQRDQTRHQSHTTPTKKQPATWRMDLYSPFRNPRNFYRVRNHVKSSNLPNKSPSKIVSNDSSNGVKRNFHIQKRLDSLHSNGPVRGVFREDPNWSVEKGLLFKRRAELIATLKDPASTKRRVPASPHLRPLRENNNNHYNNLNNNAHLETPELQSALPKALNSLPDRVDRSASVIEIKPSRIKQIAVPENVARLFAPRKGSSHCYVCDKRLYLIERLMAFGLFFHRHCFRCSECGSQLQTDKATCVRAVTRNERAPPQFGSRAPSSSPSRAQFLADLTPYHRPPNVTPLPSRIGQSALLAGLVLADLTPYNRPPNVTPLPSRIGQSALLAGLVGGDDSEEVMGVPTSFRLPLRHRTRVPTSESSSTTTSPERRPPSQLCRLIGSNGDKPRSNGIRDDAAPGPDCYLAGHLGLPEVERRANWELNQSAAVTGWPDASIPDILEHMSSSESEQFSTASDHEEVSITSSTLTEDFPKRPTVKTSTSRCRPSAIARKISRVRTRVLPAHTNSSSMRTTSVPHTLDLFPSTSEMASQGAPNKSSNTPLTIVHPADWSACNGSLPVMNAGSATSSLLSSPAHQSSIAQSRMTAKQKFCLEPPKPFTIDPKQFVSSRNRDRCVTTELYDCAEELGSITDADPCHASMNYIPQYSDTGALNELSNFIHIPGDSIPASTEQFKPDHVKFVTRTSSNVPLTGTYEGLPEEEDPRRNIDRPAPEPVLVAPVAALDEFHDMDSTSTITERSSIDLRTDSEHQRSENVRCPDPRDGAPLITSVTPPAHISISYFTGEYDNVNNTPFVESRTPKTSHHRIHLRPEPVLSPTFSVFVLSGSQRRVLSDSGLVRALRSNRNRTGIRSAQSYLTETDTSEETTSSTDLDSVPIIRPLSGALSQIQPRPVTSTSDACVDSRLRSAVRKSCSSIPREPSFRSRCANRNRQTVELTRELESLEHTMQELERAGVKAERELYSIGPRNGTTTRRYSHKSCCTITESRSPVHRNYLDHTRARTLSYHVSHAGQPPANTTSQHSPSRLNCASERRYSLLKRLAALLTTKSILLEYATTVSACRDQLRLENEQEDEEQENVWMHSPRSLHSGARLCLLTRCLSDPSLSQVQMDRLTELQQATSRPTGSLSQGDPDRHQVSCDAFVRHTSSNCVTTISSAHLEA
ncbi:Protein-methionine sulfoxide oxidase MICAL3 [Fasciola gigantica]|uniref:Protein-methionine sulfoxide oxidase MICAL3 n=1 Tax=Fasciola gigantica TaxID=46835 RepID=A0A504YBW7_FASGI|nr:Protein-methionine sulfoxide oxidase MICAL3 [Fasciola gigantica]